MGGEIVPRIVYIHVKLTRSSNILYADDQNIEGYKLSENDKKECILQHFIRQYCEYLNYPLDNSFTAYGNPDYDKVQGWITGFLFAMQPKIYEEGRSQDIVQIGKYHITFDHPFKI